MGINTYTLDGSKDSIDLAKQILGENGATYRNVRFENEGSIGMFVGQIVAYPTTYVVDSEGNIVGEPVVGNIENPENLNQLNDLIGQALEG